MLFINNTLLTAKLSSLSSLTFFFIVKAFLTGFTPYYRKAVKTPCCALCFRVLIFSEAVQQQNQRWLHRQFQGAELEGPWERVRWVHHHDHWRQVLEKKSPFELFELCQTRRTASSLRSPMSTILKRPPPFKSSDASLAVRQGWQHAVLGGDADDGGADGAVPVGGGVHLQRPHRQGKGADAVHRIRGKIPIASLALLGIILLTRFPLDPLGPTPRPQKATDDPQVKVVSHRSTPLSLCAFRTQTPCAT